MSIRRSLQRLQRRSGQRGYTAAEVIVAIGLFTIGGGGVIAMQNAAVQGNAKARRLDQAAIVGNAYVDRIQAASSTWATGSAPPAIFTGLGGWTSATGTAGFDINGFPSTTNIIFCVAHQDQVLRQNAAAVTTLIRVDLAVYWNMDMSGIADCTTVVGAPSQPGTGSTLHQIVITTVAKPGI